MNKMALSLVDDGLERCCSPVAAAWTLEILTAVGETWSQYGKQSIPLQLCRYHVCRWASTIRAWESLKIVMC